MEKLKKADSTFKEEINKVKDNKSTMKLKVKVANNEVKKSKRLLPL